MRSIALSCSEPHHIYHPRLSLSRSLDVDTWDIKSKMSGIELAGIALAILPLLITQLDNYMQGIETLGDFRTRRYRKISDLLCLTPRILAVITY
jgi:hypothetical protein